MSFPPQNKLSYEYTEVELQNVRGCGIFLDMMRAIRSRGFQAKIADKGEAAALHQTLYWIALLVPSGEGTQNINIGSGY